MGGIHEMREKRNANRILVGNLKKEHILMTLNGWDYIIEIDLKEIGWEDVGWRQVAGCCEHGNEPLHSVKCWELTRLPEELRSSRRAVLCWDSWLGK